MLAGRVGFKDWRGKFPQGSRVVTDSNKLAVTFPITEELGLWRGTASYQVPPA